MSKQRVIVRAAFDRARAIAWLARWGVPRRKIAQMFGISVARVAQLIWVYENRGKLPDCLIVWR